MNSSIHSMKGGGRGMQKDARGFRLRPASGCRHGWGSVQGAGQGLWSDFRKAE